MLTNEGFKQKAASAAALISVKNRYYQQYFVGA
jgi:hypothetical protein